MSDDGPQKAKEPIDYTGLKIGAILAPVVLLFSYFGKADTGLAVFIVLGVMTVAIKTRWNLRKHVWFGRLLFLYLPSTFHCSSSFDGRKGLSPRFSMRCQSELQIF